MTDSIECIITIVHFLEKAVRVSLSRVKYVDDFEPFFVF